MLIQLRRLICTGIKLSFVDLTASTSLQYIYKKLMAFKQKCWEFISEVFFQNTCVHACIHMIVWVYIYM